MQAIRYYTDDFDQNMLDFIEKQLDMSADNHEWDSTDEHLVYSSGMGFYWTCRLQDPDWDEYLTKQEFKQKIGMEENMSTKQFTKACLVEGMLITLRNGYTYTLKSCLNRMERAGGFMEMGDYLEDFTHKDECSGWDIVNIVYPTQVWKRTEKTETQIQFEKLQQQITELQAQADKLKATL